MKLTIDTVKLEVTVTEPINLFELMNTLTRMVGEENARLYKVVSKVSTQLIPRDNIFNRPHIDKNPYTLSPNRDLINGTSMQGENICKSLATNLTVTDTPNTLTINGDKLHPGYLEDVRSMSFEQFYGDEFYTTLDENAPDDCKELLNKMEKETK